MRSLICLSFYLAWGCVALWARDYYLDAAGGNDANDGVSAVTSAAGRGPFQTFHRALLSLVPGDSLMVASGDYVVADGIDLAWHAAGQDRICVKAADPSHPPRVHLPKGENEASPPGGAGFHIGTSHVLIDGIDIDGGINGFYIGPQLSDITLRHCKITDTYQSGIMLKGEAGHEISGVTLEQCEVCGCGRVNLDRSGKRDWPHAIIGLYANQVMIEHCLVHDNFGEGLGPYTGCSHWTILDNTVYDNWSVNIYLDTDIGQLDVERNFIYCTYGNDPTLERDRPDGIRVANERRAGTDPNPGVQDVRIVNNIICGGDRGIRCYSYGSSYVGQGINRGLIANNTIISQASHPGIEAIWIGYERAPNADVTVINNLAYSSTKTGAGFDVSGPGVTASHNYNQGDPAFSGGKVDWTRVNPPVASDYQLTAHSPCLRAGTPQGAPPDDYARAPRGLPPCPGAYEFTGAGSP